jgi:Domain of unknown function (DUF4160)
MTTNSTTRRTFMPSTPSTLLFAIEDGEVLQGDLPRAKMKLVQAWLEIHREDIWANWKLAVNGHPTHRIKPLE